MFVSIILRKTLRQRKNAQIGYEGVRKQISGRTLKLSRDIYGREPRLLIRIVIENHSTGRRPLEKPRVRREDCILKDLRAVVS